MENTMDKSLFFITLSAVCVWLIVDLAVGKKYLSNFLGTIFPFMNGGGGTVEYSEDLSTGTVENAPSSSAAGSNNEGKGQEDAPGSQNYNNAVNGTNPYGAGRPIK